MQWNSDLPSDWDEVPADPPAAVAGEDVIDVEIVEVNGGYVVRPTEAPEVGNVGTNSMYSDTHVEIDRDVAERPSQ